MSLITRSVKKHIKARQRRRRTAQELVLAVQAPFDLGDEIFRQPQVLEGLLEGLGGVLRLAAVAREALVRCAIPAPASFGALFSVSCGGEHGKSFAP
jgi:hypothetical protein